VKHLKNARSILVTLVLGVLCLRIILWAVAPLIPYMVSAIIFVAAFTFIFGIMWRRSSKL
jgi:hypothetical protein